MYPPDHPRPAVPDGGEIEARPFDPESLRLVPDSQPVAERKVELAAVRRRRAGRCVAPMPLEWFRLACRLPGKAAALAVVIWHLARLRKSDTLILTQTSLDEFGISRQAKYRALRSLESAGLITVQRRDKKNPQVTVLRPSGSESSAW